MTSLKKLIAVAAASLPLVGSAQQAAAPAPLYQWYGTLNVNGQWTEASRPRNQGAATTNVTSRIGISVDSSNVGIRGTADTGQFGLGVVYQCETSAPIDGLTTTVGGAASITTTPSALQIVCNRNSRLGVSGTWGTLFYGNWDTPYKAAWYGTKADDAFGNTDVYDAAGLMGSPGFKTKSTAASTTLGQTNQTTFNIRAANSIAYHSPKFQGLQIKAQHSTNENASNDGRISPMLWSVGANYDRGPFSILAAYERHDDFSGIGAMGGVNTKSTVDTGLRVGAGYQLDNPFGATTIGAVYEMLSYGYGNTQGLANTVKEVQKSGFMLNVKHRMGSHEFRARYEYADGLELKVVGTFGGVVGTGAQNYALGYAYYLSSAAQVYAYFTKIENERNATYTFATAGVTAVTTNFTAGADPMAVGLGLRYAF